MSRRIGWPVVVGLCLVLAGCAGSGGEGGGSSGGSIRGVVQKGPFVEGALVTVYQLDDHLIRTRNVATARTDALGAYTVEGTFSGPVEVVVVGKYYDEVGGGVSSGETRLLAITDSSESRTVNVNVLTDLCYERIRTLAGKGQSLARAGAQAKTEVLTTFHVDPAAVPGRVSELDILKAGDANAALLAVSCYVMEVARGRVSTDSTTPPDAERVLNDLGLDLAASGNLKTASFEAELKRSASRVNPDQVRQNLIQRMQDLGATVAPPEIASVVDLGWTIPTPVGAGDIAYRTRNVITGPSIDRAGRVVWVESAPGTWSILQQTASGVSVVRTSQETIESASAGGGEVVWSEVVDGHYQIFSSQRGRLTAGDLDNYTPRISESGEVVWASRTCGPGGCSPMQIVSLTQGPISPPTAENYRPAITSGGEVVWDQYDGLVWRIVSNRRGTLKEFDDPCVHGGQPAVNAAETLLWTEVNVCGTPPYERRLLSSLGGIPLFSDFVSMPAAAINDAGVVVFAARDGEDSVIYRKAIP